MLNAFSDKAAFCAANGVSIKPDDWPCAHLPQELCADRGEMLGLAAESIVAGLGITLAIAPPYRPDWKAIVESRFRLLNQLSQVHWTPGGVAERIRERGERDYRHDYPWLKDTIAKHARPPKPTMQKVKWEERDQLLAAQVRAHAALLYQTDVSTRISATMLARAVGKQALIEKFFMKLPLTTRTIRQLEETVEAFQCRRIARIVDESRARGDPLHRWRILRIAGLAPP